MPDTVSIAFLGLCALVTVFLIWDGSHPGGLTYRSHESARIAAESRRPRAWYELPGDLVAIRSYQSPELATADANKAAPFGWTVSSVTTSDGHVNVGRTVSGAVLTGGISLLLGGSRTKGAVTVTYTRQEIRLVEQAS